MQEHGQEPSKANLGKQHGPQAHKFQTTQTKHHHRSRRPPTQHAPAKGGPRTKTARPSKGGGTHKHGTPQQGGEHAPAEHQPRPGQHHRQPTPDNAGRTAAETTANQQNQPGIQPATTPRTETRTRRHSIPHQGECHAQTRQPKQGRGHTPAQHQPRPGQQHNRDHNPPNR